MDAREIERLLRIIHANGHQAAYLPRTKAELIAHGATGHAERALGEMKIKEWTPGKDEKCAYICTVVQPGEMLTMPDNATAKCAWGCGRTIQFRPWAPPDLERVCLYCMADRKKDDQ